MTKIIYVYFGDARHPRPDLQIKTDEFRRTLTQLLGDEFELPEGKATDRGGGFRFRPSLPCDGILLVPIYAYHPNIIFDNTKIKSPADRQPRDVNVLQFGLGDYFRPRIVNDRAWAAIFCGKTSVGTSGFVRQVADEIKQRFAAKVAA